MHLHHHTDDELLALARKGFDSAFAVLVYRHAPRLLDAAAGQGDPLATVVEALSGAMRTQHDRVDDVSAWLDAHLAAVARPGNDAAQIPAELADDMDATVNRIWSQLQPRWPHGRQRRIPSHAVSIAATILVAVAVSAAIPWFVLGGYGDEPTIHELRAFVVEPFGDPAEAEDTEVDIEEEEEEPLPTFDFPVPPEDRQPEPTPDEVDDVETDEDNGEDDSDADSDAPANDDAEEGEAEGEGEGAASTP